MPSRVTIAFVAFVFCCLLSSAKLVTDVPRLANMNANSEEVANRSDRRFADLKTVLPKRGIVGYVGEPGTRALADYYLTQYALAPLVVERSPRHALVVGNFPGGALSQASLAGLRLVKDLGHGVFLFANEDAK